MSLPAAELSREPSPCQSCGACCSYSHEWPRFSIESDAELELIPQRLVSESLGGMGCAGDRCLALTGDIGVATACSIYAIRPVVCRTCQPGDEECLMARRKFSLGAIAPVAGHDADHGRASP